MAVNMDIVNLTLGIVGTIAGVVSLSVHLWRLRRENPRLEMKVLNCEHNFERQTNALSFWSEIEIRNLGDRGTNLLGIDLVFGYEKKEYTLKMTNQENEVDENSIKWIRPHETIKTLQVAFTKFEVKPINHIECTFIIYHTHGAEKIKAKSKKREESKH